MLHIKPKNLQEPTKIHKEPKKKRLQPPGTQRYTNTWNCVMFKAGKKIDIYCWRHLVTPIITTWGRIESLMHHETGISGTTIFSQVLPIILSRSFQGNLLGSSKISPRGNFRCFSVFSSVFQVMYKYCWLHLLTPIITTGGRIES